MLVLPTLNVTIMYFSHQNLQYHRLVSSKFCHLRRPLKPLFAYMVQILFNVWAVVDTKIEGE